MLDRAPIGVLGGSFNPPHEGHRALVMHAMRRLDLAGVKVLVSPQNPLKKAEDYAPFEDRLAQTKEVMWGLPKVTVEPEADEGPVYAIHTVTALLKRERHRRFVYLLGADSFANLHRWAQWRDIMTSIPIAVLSRPGYRMSALQSAAAIHFAYARVKERDSTSLAQMQAPAWCFLEGLHQTMSSSAIRSSEMATPAA